MGREGEAAAGPSVGRVPVPALLPQGSDPSLGRQAGRAPITGGREQELRAPGQSCSVLGLWLEGKRGATKS